MACIKKFRLFCKEYLIKFPVFKIETSECNLVYKYTCNISWIHSNPLYSIIIYGEPNENKDECIVSALVKLNDYLEIEGNCLALFLLNEY